MIDNSDITGLYPGLEYQHAEACNYVYDHCTPELIGLYDTLLSPLSIHMHYGYSSMHYSTVKQYNVSNLLFVFANDGDTY